MSRTERACMLCAVIQPMREFVSHGCPNCEAILAYRGDEGLVQECTSPAFEGLVALCDNQKSWTARWLRIDGFQPGLYAVKINGRLPAEMVDALEGRGIMYRPRDGSAQE